MTVQAYSDTEVVREIRRMYNKRGSTPTQEYFSEHSSMSYSTVIYHFGSYNEGMKAAGLETSYERQSIDTDELLFDIECGTECLGHPPSINEYKQLGTYSASVFVERFGSWRGMLEEAELWNEYLAYQKEQGQYESVVAQYDDDVVANI